MCSLNTFKNPLPLRRWMYKGPKCVHWTHFQVFIWDFEVNTEWLSAYLLPLRRWWYKGVQNVFIEHFQIMPKFDSFLRVDPLFFVVSMHENTKYWAKTLFLLIFNKMLFTEQISNFVVFFDQKANFCNNEWLLYNDTTYFHLKLEVNNEWLLYHDTTYFHLKLEVNNEWLLNNAPTLFTSILSNKDDIVKRRINVK